MEESAVKPSIRTGGHYCTKCLEKTPASQYFKYDHLCKKCFNGTPVQQKKEEEISPNDVCNTCRKYRSEVHDHPFEKLEATP
jgi:hypothetical protein